MTLILALLPGSLLLWAATSSGLDTGTLLASYGVAAPFAAICFWGWRQERARVDAERSRAETLAEQNETLHAERLRDLQDFAARMTPMLYDASRLYEQGNERLTKGLTQADELRALSQTVEELVRKMGER